MMGGTKLKPCPFCGGTNAATRCSRRGEYGETLYPFYFVRCCSCGARGPIVGGYRFPGSEDRCRRVAVDVWNRREQ